MTTTNIRKLRKQLRHLLTVAGEETTITQALILLEIAINPGELITHMSERLPSTPTHTTVGRAVDVLGSHQGRNTRRIPAGLLERRDLPSDRRVKELWLTKKGERLIAALE